MKERPILFSAPMVRALLAGTKTQTRRALRYQPSATPHAYRVSLDAAGKKPVIAATWISVEPDGDWCCLCPYGVPGDRLWVKETWRAVTEADATRPRDMLAAHRIWYEADAAHQPGFGKLRPSIFMPRWASRITLEVTGVCVQRLQAITRGDAMDEGCPFANMAAGPDPRQWYADLWNQINGAGSWDTNPWVWVVEFKRLP